MNASASEHSHQGKKKSGHDHDGIFGERTELAFALLSGCALAAGWLAEYLKLEGASLPLYWAAYGFGGYYTLLEALDNVKKRQFQIDTLMLVAAIGAGIIGHWSEGALLLFLFSLGHALENYAMGRAKRAIEALGELAPERALVKRNGGSEDIPVEQLEVGDIVIIKPNERIPADGYVVRGDSSVNQAPVTGESAPVDKQPLAEAPSATLEFSKAPNESRVFAGTINGAGALEVFVARKAHETTLARVVRMVAEAETQRSPTQQFTQKLERVFVPIVLAVVAVLMFAWMVIDEPFSASFYRAMAVLVAASPCALAISVPSAILSGVARAGRGGVLVKGGAALENLGTLDAIAFDKTGTLTEGKPRLTDVVPAPGKSEQELLSISIAIEQVSDHPLAAAVVRDGRTRAPDLEIPEASDVESITGKGIRGVLKGSEVWIGKPAMFEAAEGPAPSDELRAEATRLEQNGRTVMMVRSGDQYIGLLGVMDTERASAADVLQRLQAIGIRRLIMLTGDNQNVADVIAKKVGLTDVKGGLMPEDKVSYIADLARNGGKVAMVGDGVNDAPAMAKATVGVAMGAAGSDVALETADVALMADDLTHLPFAVGLSRKTSAIIKQNLWASLGVVALLVPSTIFGLKIGVAILFHEGSTLLVVANALRLLAYREPEAAVCPRPN